MASVAALPWCENCASEVEAETNESNGFTYVGWSHLIIPRGSNVIVSVVVSRFSPRGITRPGAVGVVHNPTPASPKP
jgi:hypothetical protein